MFFLVNQSRDTVFMKNLNIKITLNNVICFSLINAYIMMLTLLNALIKYIFLSVMSLLLSVIEHLNLNQE